jgi:hypothetical protein
MLGVLAIPVITPLPTDVVPPNARVTLLAEVLVKTPVHSNESLLLARELVLKLSA